MRTHSDQHFIIYTPPYRVNVGGVIALHNLCQLLNEQGFPASLWYHDNPVRIDSFSSLFKKLRYWLRKFMRPDRYCSPHLDAASTSQLQESVVVYPEVTAGNPLKAKRVVRWLLHKPGFHTGVINYGKNDLFFYFKKDFDDPELNPNPDNHLQIINVMRDIYKQTNFGERRGTCYMVRKGKGRELNYHPQGALLVDNYSHQELASVFNQYEYFISYDLYTMYSTYAAMCGCKSVVVPANWISKDEWHSDEFMTGVAYGIEDLDRADQTKSEMFKVFQKAEENSINSVNIFAQRCMAYFR